MAQSRFPGEEADIEAKADQQYSEFWKTTPVSKPHVVLPSSASADRNQRTCKNLGKSTFPEYFHTRKFLMGYPGI